MALSEDILALFAKTTKDEPEETVNTTVYGTTVEYNGKLYVKIDGSDALTPISKTTDVVKDERVTVDIKNHTATVTGNVSSPAARTDDVKNISEQISEFEIIVADKVSTEELEAERGRIDTLESDNVTIKNTLTATNGKITNLESDNVTINEKLTAAEADIEDLNVKKVSAEFVEATYATIENLKATNAEVYNFKATYGEFTVATAEQFKAVNANIENLEADKLSADQAAIKYATIEKLNATNANVNNLDADIADINTLIFGSASGTSIQTSFANAVIAQLGDAQIKSAMIQEIVASKITSGDINTNDVRVISEDGKLVISDETIQISDQNRVRVQIGKDSSNDYSINVWDADGQLMFSQGGITDKAIKDAIIRNDMVADNANISGKKLDIDSVVEEINDGSTTIKSTKVYLDENKQTLDVAFKSMTTEVSDVKKTVSTQGTSISTIQGQIEQKIWQQDITTAIDGVEIGGRNLQLGTQHWTDMIGIGDGASISGEVFSTPQHVYSDCNFIEVAPGEQIAVSVDVKCDIVKNQNGVLLWQWFSKQEIGDEYANRLSYEWVVADVTTEWQRISATIEVPSDLEVRYLSVGLRARDAGNVLFKHLKVEKGTKATDWTPAPEDTDSELSTLNTKYSDVKQTVDGLSTTVANHTTQIQTKADNSTVTEVSNKVVSMEQDLSGFRTTVSETYTTKKEFNDAEENIDKKFENYSTTVDMNSAIDQKVGSITQTVSETYTTKKEFNDLQVGGRNLQLGTQYWSDNLVTVGTGTSISGEVISFPQSIYNDCDFIEVTPGEFITVSVDIKCDIVKNQNGVLLWQWYDEANIANRLSYLYVVADVSTEWKRITATTAVPMDATKYLSLGLRARDAGCMYFKHLKVEKGTKATDWTPAPEDVQQEIDGITVGGRNLIIRSTETTNTYIDATGTVVPAENNATSDYISVTPEEYMFTKTTSQIADINAGGYFRYAWYDADKNYIGRTANNNNEFKWVAPKTASFIRIAYPTDSNVKFEKGNKATGWTPAPEDVQSSIDDVGSVADDASERVEKAESIIQQLSDTISMLITDGTGASLMTQTEDGWTFSMGNINDALNNVSNGLDDLTKSVSSTDEAVSILESAVNDLGVLSNYVKITTDGEQPCIELGTGNSDFKLLITNTDIRFMEGSDVPAYINNQSLHITKAVVEEELVQGDFIWKVRSNGNMGLMWKGVSS